MKYRALVAAVRCLMERFSVFVSRQTQDGITWTSGPTYNVTSTDATIVIDSMAGPVDVYLPPAADMPAGRRLTFKRAGVGGNMVTIHPASGETIDEDDVKLIANDNGSLTIRPYPTLSRYIVTAEYNA